MVYLSQRGVQRVAFGALREERRLRAEKVDRALEKILVQQVRFRKEGVLRLLLVYHVSDPIIEERDLLLEGFLLELAEEPFAVGVEDLEPDSVSEAEKFDVRVVWRVKNEG